MGCSALCACAARARAVMGSGTCRCYPRGLYAAARVVSAATGALPRVRGSALFPRRFASRGADKKIHACAVWMAAAPACRCRRVHLSLIILWLFPVRRLRGFSLWFGWPAGAIRCVPSPFLEASLRSAGRLCGWCLSAACPRGGLFLFFWPRAARLAGCAAFAQGRCLRPAFASLRFRAGRPAIWLFFWGARAVPVRVFCLP